MKNLRIVWVATVVALVWAGTSCTDKCEQTTTFRTTQGITITLSELRAGVKTEAARTLENPGKIYVKGNYLFINEVKAGVHIIDNANPASPRAVSFLAIPGNVDMAVKGNILYADSYSDMVAFDITNPLAIKEVGREEAVFPMGQIDGIWWSYDPSTRVIRDARWQLQTQEMEVDCDSRPMNGCPNCVFFDRGGIAFTNAQSAGVSGGSGTGTGGSMARFAIVDNFLYAVTNQDMKLFNIQNAVKPQLSNNIKLGWGIETIFPYRDKLFIGSTTGMHIYDNANPATPVHLSTLQHVQACDPVVVHDNYAYVTLRTGTMCNRGADQLDVVNITDAKRPFVLKSYPMQNPHGLGIDYPNLFICEGKYGLKSFDAKDPAAIDKNQLAHMANINAYDVIPLSGTLLMIGKDGLYQYDYKDPKSLKLLSVMPVVKKETR
jgi:hypothetical protein